MNQPIISPWIFYFAEIAVSIKVVAGVIAGVLAIVILVGVVCAITDNYELDKKRLAINTRYFIVPFIISLVLTIFCPTRNTVYNMFVANQITPNNIQQVQETGKDFVEYIIDKVKEAQEE